MPQKKFIRTSANRYSKLGVRRKNKQKYRKGKGIDNKMRLNMKGHSRKVKDGFRTAKKTRNLIKELKPITINNVNDLNKIKSGMIGILAKIGNKKKKELLEYVIKNNIKINIDAKKNLDKIEAKFNKAKKEKEGRKSKKMLKDKKARKEAEKKEKEEAKKEEADAKKENSEEKKTEEKKTDNKEIKQNENKNKEGKKDTLTNNYGRGK